MPPLTVETPLLSAAAEAQLFWRLRRWVTANLLRQTLRESRLRAFLVVLLSGVFWGGLFALFIEAFKFLAASLPNAATRDEAVRAVFGVFFASLTVMLAFSSGIILYSSLYRSREVQFLMTTPCRGERVFLHKFQEALLLSSWGFVLLGSPMWVAYGLVALAPWYYYALLLPFLVAFVVIPGGIGAIVCLVVMWRIPKIRLHAVSLMAVSCLVVGAWIAWSVFRGPEGDLLTPSWFDSLLTRLRFSEHRLLPNWWLSTGLLEAAGRQWQESLLFLALLVSNALLMHQAAVAIAGRIFRRSYHDSYTEGAARRRPGAAWIDRWMLRATFFLSPQMRLLMVKDLRLFRRDPLQWSQFLIFLGLLLLYFLNVRRFRYDINHATWVNMISFLNVTVVGLILSTFTSRFIFPMISLEGRRFWILGLLPVRRETILWSKFLFAALGSMFACSLLIVLSDLMLRVLPLVLGIHLLACALLCTGLSAIAVGMGALMPNLREESPAKIAAGFGGTLNLVLSAIYIVAIVTLTAVPCHFYVAAKQSDLADTFLYEAQLPWWLALGTALSVLLGAAATIVPLRMGFKAFRELEF